MTLAEQIIEHCVPTRDAPSAPPAEGYGALLEQMLDLAALVVPVLGRTYRLADGVTLRLPADCRWSLSRDADGALAVHFVQSPPVVSAAWGPFGVSPQLADARVVFATAAIELECCLRLAGLPVVLPATPFRVRIPY